MANISPQPAGALTYAAANSGGDTLLLGTADNPIFLVKNGAGADITVTLTAVNDCSQGFLHDQTVTVTAGTEQQIIPAAQTIDRTPATSGHVGVGYSSATSVTIALIAS